MAKRGGSPLFRNSKYRHTPGVINSRRATICDWRGNFDSPLLWASSLFVESPVIVTYSKGNEDEDKLEEKLINTQVQRNPAAPSSALAKVIASTSTTTTGRPS